jgi:hypothetical protein
MTTRTEARVDVDVLRHEIEKTYAEVSSQPDKDFIFPTGRAWAQELGYPEPELTRLPEESAASFAGAANHWQHGPITAGATVLDLGCGAGTDLLSAAQMTGPAGRAIGIDMTAHRAGTAGRHLRPPEVRAHPPEGRQVRGRWVRRSALASQGARERPNPSRALGIAAAARPAAPAWAGRQTWLVQRAPRESASPGCYDLDELGAVVEPVSDDSQLLGSKADLSGRSARGARCSPAAVVLASLGGEAVERVA